jgi:adenosylhomocysteine nucleosidase
MRIALTAALPQEYRPFLKRGTLWRRVSTRPYTQYLHVGCDREILLVETGMGRKPLQAGLDRVIRKYAPDLLISFGFAGSLHERLEVGDLCRVESFFHLDAASPPGLREPPFYMAASADPGDFSATSPVRKAAIFTVELPKPKESLVKLCGDIPSLLDMESYHVARFAMEAKIPFLCLRSVSDGCRDAIDFDVEAITDGLGRVRMMRVLGAVARHPQWMRSFLLSWKRSRAAGKTLADGLCPLLTLPLEKLRKVGAMVVPASACNKESRLFGKLAWERQGAS